MMRPSRIKAKLKRDEPVLLPMLHLIDPAVYELASTMGFDGIWMDLEHHGTGLETAANLMRAAIGDGRRAAGRPRANFCRWAACSRSARRHHVPALRRRR